jgi:hypothetical protein
VQALVVAQQHTPWEVHGLPPASLQLPLPSLIKSSVYGYITVRTCVWKGVLKYLENPLHLDKSVSVSMYLGLR